MNWTLANWEIFIPKWTPITARYTTINVENVVWISWKLITLAKENNIDILNILWQLKFGWKLRDESYFSKLDTNTSTRVSWIIELLSIVEDDTIISNKTMQN